MIFHQQPKFLVIIVFFMLITACASKKPAVEQTDSSSIKSPQIDAHLTQPKQQASTLTSWEMTGAMAARHHEKAWTASFNWTQRGINDYQIRLFGPIGSGTVLIEHQNGLTTYRDGAHVSSSHDENHLLKQKTGVALPVGNLYYWARGLPAPGPMKSIEYDSLHRLQSFQQAGYTIEYLNIVNVNGMNLPQKIKLQGQGILVKVVIKQWKI